MMMMLKISGQTLYLASDDPTPFPIPITSFVSTATNGHDDHDEDQDDDHHHDTRLPKLSFRCFCINLAGTEIFSLKLKSRSRESLIHRNYHEERCHIEMGLKH